MPQHLQSCAALADMVGLMLLLLYTLADKPMSRLPHACDAVILMSAQYHRDLPRLDAGPQGSCMHMPSGPHSRGSWTLEGRDR